MTKNNSIKARGQAKKTQAQKEYDAELKERMKALAKVGLYNPKSQKLTKHRRSEIKKRFDKYSEYLDDSKFVAVPLRGKNKKDIAKNAKDAGLLASVKAVFIPASDDFNKAKISKNRKLGTYTVIREGVGPEGEKLSHSEILLSEAGRVLSNQEKFEKYVKDTYANNPGKSFRIRSFGNQFASRNSFNSPQDLFRLMNRYQSKVFDGGQSYDNFMDGLELVWTDGSMSRGTMRSLIKSAKSGFKPSIPGYAPAHDIYVADRSGELNKTIAPNRRKSARERIRGK
jgi:hypothetical protein